MRTGLILYGSLDGSSGGYLYDRMLVEHLRRAGDRVELLSLPWRNYARHMGDNFSASLLRRLEQALDGLDLLLQDELNHPSLFLLNRRLKARRGAGLPVIAIVHHLRSSEARPAWQNRLYRAVERRYLQGVDGFIFNSRTTREEVVKALGGRAPDRQVVAYPAADHRQPEIEEAEIAARACEPGPLRVLFAGNLIPRKGVHTLLEAAGRLPEGRVALTIAGSPQADRAYARRLQAQAEGLGGRVRFLGRVEDSALRALMRESHVLAAPSSYEGFGIVYLEGMGFGLPAVGGAAGAAGELITPGENGFLVPPGEAGPLAGRLAELAADRPRLARMGRAARRRYLAHPTWEQSAAQAREFLLSCLTA